MQQQESSSVNVLLDMLRAAAGSQVQERDLDESDAKRLIDGLWPDDNLDILPSRKDPRYKKIRSSIMISEYRRTYIKKIGYVLFTREFISELVDILEERSVRTFIELQAGTGAFTRILVERDFQGFGRTLEIPDKNIDPNSNHWGLERSQIYTKAIEDKLLILGDIRSAEDPTPDLIISAWIPYGGGEEVQQYFESCGYPEWYLVIGEGYGGCTANEPYFDWLELNYIEDTCIESLDSFSGIYDGAVLYKRKER